MEPSKTSVQDMKELQKRYNQLNEQRIRAHEKLEQSTKTLAGLQKEAKDKYGTDDLSQLRQKLAEMTSENERKRAEYQRHLCDIENQLVQVEASHAEASAAGKETRP